MRKFLPLLLCLLLSVFTLARATKTAHVFAPETDAKASVNDASTEDEAAPGDDDNTGASNDEGEDMNDDDGEGAVDDEGTGPDDGGNDDGDDDGSGDQGE
jgi:hypothetical protein